MRTKIKALSPLRAWCRRHTALLLVMTVALALGAPTNARADVITGGGLYDNGKGGQGIDGTTNNSIWVGDGAGTPTLEALPDCDTSTSALNYDQTGTPGSKFSCRTIAAGTVEYKFVTLSKVGPLTNEGVFISPNGLVSATETRTQVLAAKAGNLSNLSCAATGAVGGTSLKVELKVGTYGSTLTWACGGSDLCATVTGTTPSTPDTSTIAVTVGQQINLQAVAVGTTNDNIYLACSWTLT